MDLASGRESLELELALGVTAASAVQLDEVAADRLQTIAQGLLEHTETISAEINRRAIAAEPGLADYDDVVAVDTTMQSTRANVGAIISMLAYGVPGDAGTPSVGALRLFERLAEREDGLAIVLRGYRVGIMELWQIWSRYLASQVDDADELYTLQAASTSFMLTYIDRVSSELHEQWTSVRRRHRRGDGAVPDDLVRAALFGPVGGADLSLIGYSLERMHLAVALDPGFEDGMVAQLVSRLALEACAQSCVMHLDEGWVMWLALERALDEKVNERVTSLLARAGGTVGVSDVGAGEGGFRSAYREALDARRVGLLRRSEGVTLHHDVALLAVLCADTERARALAQAELGPLATGDDGAERLRETLRAYLACGENQQAAAHRLGVHQKTVAYRLRQAEGLLGRRIGERRAELEASLLLHRVFDGAR
jgi:hypothetical protein